MKKLVLAVFLSACWPNEAASPVDEISESVAAVTIVSVPADYDGDGIADWSIRTSDGIWYIDYASNGFGGWEGKYADHGDAACIPVPADYDGDGKVDLSCRDPEYFMGMYAI